MKYGTASSTGTPQPPTPLGENLAAQWMLKDGVTFLNHGSFGAAPREVFAAHEQWRRRLEAEPIELIGRRCGELLDEAKKPVGEFLGMDPADFGFVTNATEGVNAVLRSLTFEPGDELLTTSHVYNAVRLSMKHTAARWGATYREIDLPLPVRSAAEIVAKVVESAYGRIRLFVVDHVTSPTALVFPVRELIVEFARHGVDVLVDGAHAPGMLPLDIHSLGAAYYAGNLHKWCCAPKGSGVLWVSKPRQKEIHPLIVSHLYGQGLAQEFSWQGTRDLGAWLTIPNALAFMASFGWEHVQAHNHAMAAWAHRLLCEAWEVEPISPLDGSLLGSMAAVRLPGELANMTEADGKALQQRLYTDHQLEVPLVFHANVWLLRVSCQLYNTPADYHRVAEVISSLSK